MVMATMFEDTDYYLVIHCDAVERYNDRYDTDYHFFFVLTAHGEFVSVYGGYGMPGVGTIAHHVQGDPIQHAIA